MAEYLLRSALNPSKVVKCHITFRHIVNEGEDGEPVWVIQISTSESHKEGGTIKPEFIHTTSLDNLSDEIREATNRISSQIEWGESFDDVRPPFVSKYRPQNNSIVDIRSDVYIRLEDLYPSAGIDLNSIKLTVNGFDVTDELELTGTPFDYNITWRPNIRVMDYY